MKKFGLILLYMASVVAGNPAQKTIRVLNSKPYGVHLIIQSYFNQHDIFYYAWPLCNQVWNDYGAEQNSYFRGTYQPIKNVCFQALINPSSTSTFIPADIPDSLNQGFTVYVWDRKDGIRGRLFMRMNVPFGATLHYPNDFFPR